MATKKKPTFRERLKIKVVKAGLGKSAVDGKWYGWSHRAYYGFKTRQQADRFRESVS